jgi:hypothetical protein
MANAAAIKGALLQTKSLKQQTREQPKVQPFQLEEDSKWIKKVIHQEHLKPLEVSKDYVLEYEKREKENADRLANQVDRHIGTLKQLRMKLEARHDLKVRTEEYRNWQKDFQPKKHAVMVGKTLEEIEQDNSPTNRQHEMDEINDELLNKTLNKSATGHTSSQELSNVLDSLSKLADLEKRISSLEKENKYDELVRKESPTANQRTQFEFRKKRAQIQDIHPETNVVTSKGGNANNNTGKGAGPVGMVYEVRQKKAGSGQDQSKFKVNLPSGNGAMAVKAKRNQQFDDYQNEYDDDDNDGGRGGGRTFLTAQPSDDNLGRQRDEKRRERLRQRELAPAGVKSLKSRVQIKKVRQKEINIGARKHEEAMREMNRRKTEQSQKRTTNDRQSNRNKVSIPSRGIAAGVHTKNKHLQEFQKAKSGFSKRKGNYIPEYSRFVVSWLTLLFFFL